MVSIKNLPLHKRIVIVLINALLALFLLLSSTNCLSHLHDAYPATLSKPVAAICNASTLCKLESPNKPEPTAYLQCRRYCGECVHLKPLSSPVKKPKTDFITGSIALHKRKTLPIALPLILLSDPSLQRAPPL